MSCYNTVPISIIPPTSQGVGPLVWQNGSQINRLNPTLNPALVLYDGSVTRFGDGSAQAPITLPNVQQFSGTPQFIVGSINGTIGYYNYNILTGLPSYIYLSSNGTSTGVAGTISNFFVSATGNNTFSTIANGVYELECLLTVNKTANGSIAGVAYTIGGSVASNIIYANGIITQTASAGNSAFSGILGTGYPDSTGGITFPVQSISFTTQTITSGTAIHTALLKTQFANGSFANTITIQVTGSNIIPYAGSYAKLTRIA